MRRVKQPEPQLLVDDVGDQNVRPREGTARLQPKRGDSKTGSNGCPVSLATFGSREFVFKVNKGSPAFEWLQRYREEAQRPLPRHEGDELGLVLREVPDDRPDHGGFDQLDEEIRIEGPRVRTQTLIAGGKRLASPHIETNDGHMRRAVGLKGEVDSLTGNPGEEGLAPNPFFNRFLASLAGTRSGGGVNEQPVSTSKKTGPSSAPSNWYSIVRLVIARAGGSPSAAPALSSPAGFFAAGFFSPCCPAIRAGTSNPSASAPATGQRRARQIARDRQRARMEAARKGRLPIAKRAAA